NSPGPKIGDFPRLLSRRSERAAGKPIANPGEAGDAGAHRHRSRHVCRVALSRRHVRPDATDPSDRVLLVDELAWHGAVVRDDLSQRRAGGGDLARTCPEGLRALGRVERAAQVERLAPGPPIARLAVD